MVNAGKDGLSIRGRYWALNGARRLHIGGFDDGEPHIWAHEDTERLKNELDRLVEAGGNAFRCTLADFEDQYHHSYPFHPFTMPAGGHAADAVKNQAYFDAIEILLTECEARGIVVQIELFDHWNLTARWWDDGPWSKLSDQSGNTNPDSANWRFFDAAATSETGKMQCEYVDWVIEVGSRHGNVLYQVANESTASERWETAMRAYVAARVPFAGTMWDSGDILADENMNAMSDANAAFLETSQNEGMTTLDTFFEKKRLHRALTNKPVNNTKIYNRVGTKKHPDGTRERVVNNGTAVDRMFCHILTGSASACFHKRDDRVNPPGDAGPGLSTCFYDCDGPNPTGGSMNAIKVAAKIDEAVDLQSMSPVNNGDSADYGKWTDRPANRAFAMEGPDHLVMYLVGDTSNVTYDTTGVAPFKLRWCHVDTGSIQTPHGPCNGSTATALTGPSGYNAGRRIVIFEKQ